MSSIKAYLSREEYARREAINVTRAEDLLFSCAEGGWAGQEVRSLRDMPEFIVLPTNLREVILEIISLTKAGLFGDEKFAFIQGESVDDGVVRISLSSVKGISGLAASIYLRHREYWQEKTFGTVHSHTFELLFSYKDILNFCYSLESIMIVVTPGGVIHLLAKTQFLDLDALVDEDQNEIVVYPTLARFAQWLAGGSPRTSREFLNSMSWQYLYLGLKRDIYRLLNKLGVRMGVWYEGFVVKYTLWALNFFENFDLLYYKGDIESFRLERSVPCVKKVE